MEELIKQLTRLSNIRLLMLVGVLVLFIGGTLNFLAINSNEGRMPVYTDQELNVDTHFNFQDKNEVNRFYLTDIFHLDFKIFNCSVFVSIGDFIVFTGMIGLLILIYFDSRTLTKIKRLQNGYTNS